MLDFDEILLQCGEFGRYQKALFIFEAPFAIFVTFVLFGQLFMSLHPNTLWCAGHFKCTAGNMTPFQRQNISFSYQLGIINPCFINNIDFIDTSFIKAIADWTNGGSCGRNPCNFTQKKDDTTGKTIIGKTIGSSPENIAQGYGGNGMRDGNPSYYGSTVEPSGSGQGFGNGGNRLGYTTIQATRSTSKYPPDTTDEFHEENDADIVSTSTSRTVYSTSLPSTGSSGLSQGSDRRRPPGRGSNSASSWPRDPEGRPIGYKTGSSSWTMKDLRNESCKAWVNVALHPRARIFLIEMSNSNNLD